MKKVFIFVLSLIVFFGTHSPIVAKVKPQDSPNNKFGIHITDERDLENAANLVNSSGGDWGYVTFVITESERNHDRWQKTFDQMRRLHLIPIVRLASKPNGDNWEIPQESEINNWIAFLNSLNWVTQNRYVIIANEPNHATEWGGTIDPDAYATYLNNFANKLHEASSDYFVLPAGLDASCKTTKTTMDEVTFIKRMLTREPSLFDNLDGWTSHSYPNPDFSGKSTDTGRGTIQTFSWELNYIRSFGIYNDLPVFITETGWSNQSVNSDSISGMYKYAFENVWNDKRVVAVTPFILNYPDFPFSQFSWIKADSSFYSYYEGFQKINKTKGRPQQIESGQILGAFAQPIVSSDSDFVGIIVVKNTGQSIWNTSNLVAQSDNQDVSFKNILFFDIEPLKTGLIVFKAKPEQKRGVLIKSIYLSDMNGKRVTNSFPIEAIIIRTTKMQLSGIFDRISSYFKGVVKGP